MYVPEKVTGVTFVGVRGHLVAVEAHVGRGLPSWHSGARIRRAGGGPPWLPHPTLRLETAQERVQALLSIVK
jgi:hypothetical protein